MKFIIYRQKIISFLLCYFCYNFPDPLYLNNANPYPLFSSEGRYNHLTSLSRAEIKEFIFEGKDIDEMEINDKTFHVNIMPYMQFATTGTNYEGKDALVLINNSNQTVLPLDTISAIEFGLPSTAQTPQGKNVTANISKTVPMPLGAIPEPFSFFPLFYDNDPLSPIEPMVYKNGDLVQAEYDYSENNDINTVIEAQKIVSKPFGSSYYNLVSKVVARYLGYNDTPFLIAFSGDDSGGSNANAVGDLLPSSLMYDYSNYKNNYFGLLQYPATRDPKKLFGYGYYNTNYKKIGIRGTFEWKMNCDFGFKIYTGFSNLDISQINIVDTTINYQGPTAAMMFSIYPNQIYQLQSNTSPNNPDPYVSPNIYPLSDGSTPILDSTSNAAFNANFYNSSELVNLTPDDFKTAFLQNIQYNLDNLGSLIKQNFRPYSAQSFDDTTFEIYYRKLIVYNKTNKPYKKHEESIEHMPFTLLPTASVHVTCPIAPRVPSNKIFGKPIDNNGHWELGAQAGIEFDFVNNIVFGANIGMSWYNSSDYYNVPVPTNQFNEGIYLYNANIIVIPGFSYTASLGMQVDEFLKYFDLFLEYRVVRHAEDNFIIKNINNLLPVKYMQDTHQSPPSDDVNTLDNINNGILYLEYNQELPYPKEVIVEHMKEVSSWLVNMLNLTFNLKINEDMKIGLAWQQPFWLRNAYNSTTIGLSFEMYF